MASLVQKDTDMFLKLSATSIAISMATAKLVNSFRERHAEIQKDREFLKLLQQSYIENGEDDFAYAENMRAVSAEADKLLSELSSHNE